MGMGSRAGEEEEEEGTRSSDDDSASWCSEELEEHQRAWLEGHQGGGQARRGGGSRARTPRKIETLIIAKKPPLTTLICPDPPRLLLTMVRHFTGLTRLDISTPSSDDDYGHRTLKPFFLNALAEGISSLTCLQHLDLSGKIVGPSFLGVALQGTSMLRELRLENIVNSGNYDDEEDSDYGQNLWQTKGGPHVWKTLEQSLAKQSRMQVLNLKGSGRVPVGAAVAISRALGRLHQMQHLCFPPLARRLAKLDCEAIASLNLLQSLDMHEANRQKGRQAFVKALASSGGLPHLLTLRLRRNKRSLYTFTGGQEDRESACVSLVEALDWMPALQTLCLHNWNFTNCGYNLWRGLARHCNTNSRLCRLNLEPCEIGGRKGLALLATEAAKMSSLRSLCVKV